MQKEMKVECPLCHAEPGEPCGNEPHPERIDLAKELPKKKIHEKKIHVVKKRRKAA